MTNNKNEWNKKEWRLYIAGWFLVLVMSMVYWYNDDPEFQLPFTSFNIVLVLGFFMGFLAGLCGIMYAQSLHGQRYKNLWQNAGVILALLCFCMLASIIYYLILGLLFAILVATFPNYLRSSMAWILAITAPLLAGVYDVICKDIPFYLTTKLLFVCFNCLVLQFGFKTKSERTAKEQAKTLLRELQATQTLLASTVKRDERLRIARDLHDSMGHQLTALKLQLELISHLTGAELKDKVEQAKQLSGQILDQVRHNVTEFRDTNDIELVQALEKLFENIPGLTVTFNHDFQQNHLTTRQAETLFRCAQEAVTNVLKHSNANQCQITLQEEDNNITLTIADNGGRTSADKSQSPLTPGSGTKGMLERARTLDGEVTFINDDKGCKVIMTLPLNLLH